MSCDVDGQRPRRVQFHRDSGNAFVKRLGEQALKTTRLEERRVLNVLERARTSTYGDVSIFDTHGVAKEDRR